MQLVVCGTESTSPGLCCCVFGRPAADTCFALGADERRCFDGLGLRKKGRVEKPEGYDSFVCKIASGGYSVEDRSPSSISLMLLHVKHV